MKSNRWGGTDADVADRGGDFAPVLLSFSSFVPVAALGSGIFLNNV